MGRRLGLGLGGLAGLRRRMGRPGPTAGEGRAAANRRPKWPAGRVSPLFLWQKRNREKEKKERVRERICTCGQFSRTHKNALDPGKIEVA